MAEILAGRVKWPGMSSFTEFSYTCTHGIDPSFASLIVPIGDEKIISRRGDLTFTGNRTITLRDCIINDAANIDVSGVRALKLTILDRRWKWKFGSISRRFNERDEKGRIIGQQATAADIAEVLLKEMGETRYKIDLPSGSEQAEMPFIEWHEVNPAQALMELCGQFSRTIVYQPVRDFVLIVRNGDGELLPRIDAIAGSETLDPAELPSKIVIAGAPAAFEAVILCEAVGKDIDETIKPIDELSYKPKAGWGPSYAAGFLDVVVPSIPLPIANFTVYLGPKTRDELQALAKQCIYRWWRITLKKPNGEPLLIPGTAKFTNIVDTPFPKLTSIRQLDLLDAILVADEKDPRSVPYFIPGQLYGEVSTACVTSAESLKMSLVTKSGEPLRVVTFSVDNDRKVLIADRALFKASTPEKNLIYSTPSISVRISVHVRQENGELMRYKYEQRISENSDVPAKVYLFPDIEFVTMSNIDTTKWIAKETRTNKEACEKIAKYYLEAKKAELTETKLAGERTYPGIIDLDPDGAIKQITWRIGLSGPTTQASRNTEHAWWLMPYQKYRYEKRMKLFIDRYPSWLAEREEAEKKWFPW
jgi:hypothetical protein